MVVNKTAQYYWNQNKELFEKFSKDRNISGSTKNGYMSSIAKYLRFNKEDNFQKLLDEAIAEEDAKIPMRNRKLKKRLLDFRTYLVGGTKLGTNTIKTYFTRISTLYRHFGIEFPELPPLKLKKEYITNYYDLPSKEDIRKALEVSELDMKALILFMSSSGTAKAETLSLTVEQFIKGCKDFYNDNESLEQILLDLSQRCDVVPIIYLRRIKTDKYYYTCCSPEAVQSICKYLLTRTNLKLEDKLFDFTTSLLLVRFQEINNICEWGRVGKYRFFRSHALRKYHASNIGLPQEQVDILQGRSKDVVHGAYIKENPERLRSMYKTVMENVMINSEFNLKEKKDNNELINQLPIITSSNNLNEGIDLSFSIHVTPDKFIEILQILNDNGGKQNV